MRRFSFLVLLLVLLPATGSQTESAASSPSLAADVLIVHDSMPDPMPPGIIDGNNILDLLGHFGLKGKLMSVQEYRAGDLNHYRFVIVLGVDFRKVSYPRSFLSDIRHTALPVFWVWKHLDELQADARFAKRLGFRVTSPLSQRGFKAVIYKGKSLIKGDGWLAPVEITDESKVEVLATARGDSGVSKPYMVRSGSFWYVADSPFAFQEEGDRYLAFCDVLHDFFGMAHQEERKALVRVEDVSIESDPDQLRELADYFYARHIPFQIGLIPIFKDPSEGSTIYLSDRPEFVRAVQYMVSKGGVVVMHGVFHQYRGRSADDYEFWDDVMNKPIQGDSSTLVEQRIHLGLAECFKNGIYPVTWETPHYMASTTDYRTIARYFSTSWDRMPALNNLDTDHFYPYPSVDRFGRFIIPESLGFISLENPDPDALVTNADRLQVVRDGVASFYFHPFMDRTFLEKTLNGIERLGYRFMSIREYHCRVQMDERLAQTFTAPVTLSLHDQFLHRFLELPDGRITGESYSEKPIAGTVQDAGVVPLGDMLVMEGVNEVAARNEVLHPSNWDSFWKASWQWAKSKLPQPKPEIGSPVQPRVTILWDDAAPAPEMNDQKSYFNAFTYFGFLVSSLNWREFGKESLDNEALLIVPRWVEGKLSSAQTEKAEAFVRSGGRAVLEGPGPLGQALGVRTEERSVVVDTLEDVKFGYQDNFHRTRRSTWTPPTKVPQFSVKNTISIYAQDTMSELALAVLGGHGQGRFIYLGARLDPSTPFGYSRFPYFIHYVLDAFKIRLPLERPRLELYFDPGISKPNLESMVVNWRKHGVSILYVAAYQFWPTWEYNYQYLIDLCHKNGILVYAWFELPHVSPKFWEQHPEWRAKAATGVDGGHNETTWRYHMDLDIPECREAAFSFVEDLIRKYPWDGVNIAELNYDTEGPEKPYLYTPMGAITRSAFRARAGFDPIELFQPNSRYYWKRNPRALHQFEEYRAERVTAWHRALLERLTPLARERDLEIIVTMLDSLHSPRVFRDTGIDSPQILALMDQFPFTLQVEDPSYLWGGSPDRYVRFGETYLGLIRDPKRLMFDVNVFPARDISRSLSPTSTATGIELAETLAFAGQVTGRAEKNKCCKIGRFRIHGCAVVLLLPRAS